MVRNWTKDSGPRTNQATSGPKMDKNSGNNRFQKFFNEILTNLDISLNTLVAYKLTRIIRIIMLYVKHIKVKIIYSIYYEKYEIQIM